MARIKKTYCRLCETACGLEAKVDANGSVVRLRPDKSHPISRGYACSKGTRFAETSTDPARFLRPRIRLADGSYEEVSWDRAYRRIAERIRPIIKRYGPHAVGIYAGDPIVRVFPGFMAAVLLTKALGSRNVFSGFSQDCNNKFRAGEIVHGSPMIQPIPDFDHADLIVLLGTNPVVTQSSFIHLEGGTTQIDRFIKRGGCMVIIDPLRSESAQRWGGHIPIRPGTDLYLLLALLHEFRDRFQPDDRVEGLERLLEVAAAYPIDRAVMLTGVPKEGIETLSGQIRHAKGTAFHMSTGINQGPFGTLCYVALQALMYLSGNLDRRGGSLFQPLGVRYAGMAQRMGLGTGRWKSRIGNFNSVLETLPAGILAEEIETEGTERIRALICIAGNPARTIPGSARVEQALKQLDSLVVLDSFPGATSRHADVILPVANWLERWDLTMPTGSLQMSPLLQVATAVTKPAGETRNDTRVLLELCAALGRPRGLGWLTRLAGRSLGAGATGNAILLANRLFPRREDLRGATGIPIKEPREDSYLGVGPQTPGRLVRFWVPELDQELQRIESHLAQIARPHEENSFLMLCHRQRRGQNTWLHGSRYGGKSESTAWLSPQDAQRLGIKDGERITVIGNGQQIELDVAGREWVAPGTLVVPQGRPEDNVNLLIPSGSDNGSIEPLSGQHIMTGIKVRVLPSGRTS